MQPADRFSLAGKISLAQERALMSQRNPELANVRQICAIDRIKRKHKRPFAVRRLLPWVHVVHDVLPGERPPRSPLFKKTKARAVASVPLQGQFRVPDIHSEDACTETDV